jgi:RHS repeat-associated protein
LLILALLQYCSGEQYDSDLGLYYLRARYYNPLTGRFLSRDPEDGKPLDPKTLHKYLYAGGDPVNAMDPTGREETVETFLSATIQINGPIILAVAKFGCQVQTIYNFLYTTVAFVANGGHVNSFGDPGIPVLPKYVCAAVSIGGMF